MNLSCSTAGNCTVPKNNGGFLNGTVGQLGKSGTAYGLALCPADLSRADCRDCHGDQQLQRAAEAEQCNGSTTYCAALKQTLVVLNAQAPTSPERFAMTQTRSRRTRALVQCAGVHLRGAEEGDGRLLQGPSGWCTRARTLEDGKVVAVKKLQGTAKVEHPVGAQEQEPCQAGGLLRMCTASGRSRRACSATNSSPTAASRTASTAAGRHKSQSWPECQHILQGICRGLQYLHDKSFNDVSVIHMDLKADNVLLQEAAVALGKLLTWASPGTWTPTSSRCMPREFMERGKASPKVDIYSLGLIILEMMTGKLVE
ncbi:hypothetical protein E2562_031986 [Oryza meyeriana var. granulata]|uniref:Protein kinase domain-containing protein n=1 Tax=Oryza meyeriana var. granulata TaxID=110450 RepID=A0A6G1F0H8_9ORYZ|nr:hypothetical protein E2562_031986 [Oryza meyeriana var. granulata]